MWFGSLHSARVSPTIIEDVSFSNFVVQNHHSMQGSGIMVYLFYEYILLKNKI